MYYLLALLLATTGAAYLLPHPQGKYNVTLSHIPLTSPNHTLMLSVFRPAPCASTISVPYMPPLTASYQASYAQAIFNISVDLSPILLEARLQVCPDASSPLVFNTPVLLLSPGYRGTRLYYSVLASAIASEGISVVTIDHPGDTNIIEYPDGSTAYSNASNANYEQLTPYAYLRAADMQFIIDQIHSSNNTLLPQSTHRIAVAGNSLGGVAAVIAAAQDARVAAAINLDGPFLGALPAANISQPVLTLASEHEEYPSLVDLWDKLGGEKLWVKVKGMTHEGMVDLPVLLEAGGWEGALGDVLGTIKPGEGVEVMSAYTTGWMRGVFEGDWSEVLAGKEGVEIVRKGGF